MKSVILQMAVFSAMYSIYLWFGYLPAIGFFVACLLAAVYFSGDEVEHER